MHEAEIALKNEQERKLKSQLQMSLTIIILVMLALFVIIYFYRQKQKAWRDLVNKNLQWANQDTLEVVYRMENNGNDSVMATAEDSKIVKQVHGLMLNSAFKDKELTLDTLAKKLNTSRNSLSHAINAVTGKNFNNFVNEYRIKEALKLISKNQNLYIDELYGLVGFRSRTSFYRSFRQITGLSPKEFIKAENTLRVKK
jgi:YesN/AraC family two-component response regulator